ncbi:unnamed protein product, partial [Sphenostylis stenocarpa]
AAADSTARLKTTQEEEIVGTCVSKTLPGFESCRAHAGRSYLGFESLPPASG